MLEPQASCRAPGGTVPAVKLNAAPLREASIWIGNYRRFWEESLEQLDAYVNELIEKGE